MLQTFFSSAVCVAMKFYSFMRSPDVLDALRSSEKKEIETGKSETGLILKRTVNVFHRASNVLTVV